MIGAKYLGIVFDKIGGFTRAYDGTRYLVLFGGGKYYFIYNRIIIFYRAKSGITYIVSHNHPKIKLDSYDSLPPDFLEFYNTHEVNFP